MMKRFVVPVIFLALLIAAPLLVRGFWVRLLTHTLMFCVLASSLNIMAGFTGYAPFGNMVFFGTGAYTMAVLMNHASMPFTLALVFAGGMSILVAIVFGTLFLRLRGQYFALATTGVAEAVRHVVTNLRMTGGGQGITLPQLAGGPVFVNTFFYYLMLALLVVVVAFVWRLSRNRLGYALKAIRADEDAANVMGINTTRYKIIAWSCSALFTGITGAVYAYWFSYIDPRSVFDVMWTVKMFVIMLIGGAGTVFGPIIGAFIIETLSELVWARFLYLHMGVLGTIIIIVVMFMPRGIISLVTEGKSLRSLLENMIKRMIARKEKSHERTGAGR